MKNTWMQRSSALAIAVVCATFTTVHTAKAQNIDLTTYANSGGCCFGPTTGYTAMGQTITIGANQTSLTDFMFILNPHNGGTNFDVTGNVAVWNASTSKIGATLYTSSPQTYPAGNAFDDFVSVGFTFGSNLTLTQGNQYAFFLSSYGSTGYGDAALASNNTNPYSGGQFIFNNGNPTTNPWEMWLNNLDVRLKVNFAATPAPAQLADISGLTPKLASELGLNFNPAFTGGSLQLDQTGQTFNQNFTLAGSGNAIDVNGNYNTFSGTFQNAVNGTPINLEFKNSGSGGSITFANDIGASGNSVGAITNSTIWNLSAGADVFANGISNSGQFVVANGATVTDDLNNTGYLFNSGIYNANLTNDGGAAQIWNDTTGVWNGDVLSNTNGASILTMVNGMVTPTIRGLLKIMWPEHGQEISRIIRAA